MDKKGKAKRLYLLHMFTGAKMVIPKKREKLLSKPKEVWEKSEEKKWNRIVKMYMSHGFDIVTVAFLLISSLFGYTLINILMGWNSYETIYTILVSLLWIELLFLFLLKRKINQQCNIYVGIMDDEQRRVYIDGSNICLSTESTENSWSLEAIDVMFETNIGFIVIFKDASIALLCVDETENYEEILNEVRKYAGKEKCVHMKLSHKNMSSKLY